jgi:hypothetical protein
MVYLEDSGSKDYGTMFLFGLHSSDMNFYELVDQRSKLSASSFSEATFLFLPLIRDARLCCLHLL